MPWRLTVKRIGESEYETYEATFDGAVAEAMRFAFVNSAYPEQAIEHISIDNMDCYDTEESNSD
jgi:hypothetical protein